MRGKLIQELSSVLNFVQENVSPGLILFLTIFWLLLELWKSNRKLPPGPCGIPFFGYYPLLSAKPYLDFARLSACYGEIISFRSVGNKLFVVLNGTRLIKDVLVNRADEFIGRPLESNLLEWISDGLGVTQEEGDSWKEHRRFFLHTVKNFGFGKLEIEETIHEEIKTLLNDLNKLKGQQNDIRFHVDYAANSIIAKIMLDHKFHKNGKLFPKLAKGVRDLIALFADNRFMLVGFPFRIAMHCLPWASDVRKGRTVLKNTVQTIIEEHVQTFDSNNLRDYVDSYLHHMEKLKKNGESENNTFTMKRLLSITMNMIMEGTETVSGTICSLLMEISKHPEEQAIAQKELDLVIGRERLLSWLDRSKLPYLRAFIQELFRTAMAFYITTHYSNFEETTIEGYRIPKRTIIVGNLWTINNDPHIFPDPSKFDVSRFLNESKSKFQTVGPYPFSIGKRDCVGQSLGQMEVFLIIGSILQNFTLVQGEDEKTLRVIQRI